MSKVPDNKSKLSVEYEVINNVDRHRFEITVNELVSVIPYSIHERVLSLYHTEVPENLRGLGLAHKLATYALHYAKDHDLKISPICPFIRKYIKEHPEWEKFVKKPTNIRLE